jgi:hypothetical protein
MQYDAEQPPKRTSEAMQQNKPKESATTKRAEDTSDPYSSKATKTPHLA